MGYLLLKYGIKWPNREFLEGSDAPPVDVDPPTTTIMVRRRVQALVAWYYVARKHCELRLLLVLLSRTARPRTRFGVPISSYEC